MYLLDSNACIHLLNNTSQPLAERFRQHAPTQIRLCSVVKAELLHGAHKSQRVEENLRLLRRFFRPLISIPFDDLAAEHYGALRRELESIGKPIGPHDLMIAAIARSRELTLVTHNVSEFSRVPGLRWEDWEAP